MINLERALVKDRLLNEFGILMNESDAALWLDKFEMSEFTCEEAATCVDSEKLMFFRQNDPGARECAGFLGDTSLTRDSNTRFTELDEACRSIDVYEAIDRA